MTRRFTIIIIISNIVLSLLFFLSSEFVLIALNGKIVQGANIFIDSAFPYNFPDAPPTSTAPLPNYPFFVLIFALIINSYFLIRLRNKVQNFLYAPNSGQTEPCHSVIVTNRFTVIIIIFNVIMGLLSFFSSQYVLIRLIGLGVGEAGILIYPAYPNTMGMLVDFLPMPNFMLVTLIFTLVANFYFLSKLRRSGE
jgi:hypothetical protein